MASVENLLETLSKDDSTVSQHNAIIAKLHPEPPNPFTLDMKYLLASDANPLTGDQMVPDRVNHVLQNRARDCAQALINCILESTRLELTKLRQGDMETKSQQLSRAGHRFTATVRDDADGTVYFHLPETSLIKLPREKHVPDVNAVHHRKTDSKWQAFAQQRGIKPRSRSQRNRMVWDEDRKAWIPRWGWQGKKMLDRKEALIKELPPSP